MLLNHPEGWTFMLTLGIRNLIFGFLWILGGSSWESMSTIIISAAVLIYCPLPCTKAAFGMPPLGIPKSSST